MVTVEDGPKLVPLMVKESPLVGLLNGPRAEMDGAAYENVETDTDWPATVTVTVSIVPSPGGNVQLM